MSRQTTFLNRRSATRFALVGTAAFGVLLALGLPAVLADHHGSDEPHDHSAHADDHSDHDDHSGHDHSSDGHEGHAHTEIEAKLAEAGTPSMTEVSYVIGLDIGRRMLADFNQQDLGLVHEELARGISDAILEKDSGYTEQQQMMVIMAFQKMLEDQAMAEAENNVKEAEAYLAKNKEKEGVIVTESGLQYEVLEAGDASGESPTAADTFVAHYRGTLMDGTVFDSSYDRGQPLSLEVGRVIPGWQEALQLMKPGDKWRITVPPALGYGPMGAGASIPPNALLIFEMELLDFQKADSAPTTLPGE